VTVLLFVVSALFLFQCVVSLIMLGVIGKLWSIRARNRKSIAALSEAVTDLYNELYRQEGKKFLMLRRDSGTIH
jgi:hypothetical protein